jgi:hypothetical protein
MDAFHTTEIRVVMKSDQSSNSQEFILENKESGTLVEYTTKS